MTRIIAIILIIALTAAAAWKFMPRGAVPEASRKVLFYQSPMHPWVKSDKPGKCTVCGMDLVPVHEGAASPIHASGIVMLPPGSPHVVGVQTAEIKKLPLKRTIRVGGMIGEDESRHGIISAPVEGRIDGLAMSHEGQQIAKRAPYATILSKTLLNAAADYKRALETKTGDADALRKRLEALGLVSDQINAIPTRQANDNYFGLTAPLGGTIVKSYVSEGQYVKEGDKIFEIADFTRLWFMFSVYEQDLPFIRVKQVVEVQTPSLPGEIMKARIDFISPNLDDMTKTAHVRVVLENPERKLKNKSFAQGVIEADAPEVLSVPRSAVLWPGTEPRVYVEHGTEAYELRVLKIGRVGDQYFEVLDGLAEGERVVVSGNMLIDSQAQLDREATR